MEITEVMIFDKDKPDTDNKNLKAYASITFDNSFVVKGLRVIEGKNGVFVSMPDRKLADGTYKDIAHPLNNEMRAMINSKVLEKYSSLNR